MILCVCLNPSVDTFVWVGDVQPGQVHRAQREERYPGGKGVHVALALRALGNEVTLLGVWGGATGAWVAHGCEREGIQVIGPRVQGWTRTCLTFRSDSDFDDTEILGTGPEVAPTEASEIEAAFDRSLAGAQAVTISGSLPPGLPSGYYAGLVARANAAGVPVFIDCSGEAMRAALAARPHAVHLTRREAQGVTGRESSADSLGALLENCSLACVTEGKGGTYIATNEYRLHSFCPVENLHSAVGSGDCLTAGLCHAHCQRLDPEATARLASACGAANLLCPDLGWLRAGDVWRLTATTQVRELT